MSKLTPSFGTVAVKVHFKLTVQMMGPLFLLQTIQDFITVLVTIVRSGDCWSHWCFFFFTALSLSFSCAEFAHFICNKGGCII